MVLFGQSCPLSLSGNILCVVRLIARVSDDQILQQIVIYLKSCADLILCENYSHIIIHNLSGQYFGMYPNSVCSQNAVSAYFTIKHILHFGFAEIS